MTEPSGHVSYTVKELLAEQREMIRGTHVKLDSLAALIVLKADQVAVNQIADRVDKLESKLDTAGGADNYKRWVYPLLITLLCNAATIAVIYLTSTNSLHS